MHSLYPHAPRPSGRGRALQFWPARGLSPAPATKRALGFGALALHLCLPGGWFVQSAGTASAAGVHSVRDYGAVGNGQALDTAAINRAIEACVAAGGGQVRFPPGRYLSGTVRWRSRVELHLEAGATLAGTTNLDLYETFAATQGSPPLRTSRWHRGLILAEGAENIALSGQGVIDGAHVFDPRGEERMRGPHAILLGHCRQVTVRDLMITNAANYALLFFFTDAVEVRNATFAAGWDGVHFRGSLERFCEDVRILDCRFYTGDDAIAGSYWRNVVISNCVINSSCNGLRLIGPAVDSLVTRCEFFGPGLHEHRTSRALHRTNMLAGLCLQPGAWEPMPGPLDRFRATDLTMRNVTTPLHLALRAGNTAGRVEIERLTATGAYRAPCSVESWGETAFTNVLLRDVQIEYTGGGKPEEARLPIRAPGVDARRLPAWGFFARGIQHLELNNVRLACAQEDARPMFMATGVERLTFDHVQCPAPPDGPDFMVLSNVHQVELRRSSLTLATPRCTDLRLLPQDATGALKAGQPFSAQVALGNDGGEGLGKIELFLDGQRITRWTWLPRKAKVELVFDGLTVSKAGLCRLRCGALEKTFTFQP
jgi:hypothetical protein